MTAHAEAWPPASSFIPSTLLVVGDAPEITIDPAGPLAGTLVIRVPPRLVPEVSAIAAVVFDLRSAPVDDFVVMRASPVLARLPLLLVSAHDIPEAVFLLLRADEGLVLARKTPAQVTRRLRLILELGRLRVGTAFAEQALSNSLTGLSISNLDLTDAPLVHVTKVFEEITGYARSEVLGNNCRFLQADENDQPGLQDLRRAIKARERATVVLRNYRKDGTEFWNELTVFPLLADGRATPYMAGVQHDVTALVEARAEVESLYHMLVDRQRFDHAILDGVAVGIVTTDDEGTITFVNRSAAQLLATGGEMGRVTVQDLLGLPYGPRELLGNDGRRSLAHLLRRADGVDLDLDLTVSRGEGSVQRAGFFFIFRDVGEEKIREADRRKFERLAAIGTMVAGFAHEVRNPVAAIRSIAEELLEELRDAGVVMLHVRLLLQMVERIERLVRTSLQFGRPTTPKRAPQRPWVIVSAAISELRPRFRGLDDELVIDAETDLPDVNVDERQLTQVLVILLLNALDATGTASRVRLRVRRAKSQEPEPGARRSEPPPPPEVRFEVVDDGPGITADHLGQIFDPFFTTKPSGTGLGLSIAQQIVNENSARLEVVSTPGVSTTFAITVPAFFPDS